MGYQFWTPQFTIPGESKLELLIPHKLVTIWVNKAYTSDTTPGEGIKAYLFTESGVYQGLNGTTGPDGTIMFSLPDRAYKIRADYLSKLLPNTHGRASIASFFHLLTKHGWMPNSEAISLTVWLPFMAAKATFVFNSLL